MFRHVMLQMCLKCSSFLIKTCLKFHKCSRLTTIWYTWNYPSWGGQTRSTPRKTEISNMALEFVRQIHFNSMMKTEFPVKIWARTNPFKGCFELNLKFMVPSLHALPIHVFWSWYVFLNEYTTYFSFSGAHSRQKYGLQPYFCLIGQNMSKP